MELSRPYDPGGYPNQLIELSYGSNCKLPLYFNLPVGCCAEGETNGVLRPSCKQRVNKAVKARSEYFKISAIQQRLLNLAQTKRKIRMSNRNRRFGWSRGLRLVVIGDIPCRVLVRLRLAKFPSGRRARAVTWVDHRNQHDMNRCLHTLTRHRLFAPLSLSC